MISVEEARNNIHQLTVDWGVEEVKLENALNRVLAEEILADRDFPPFDRVAMDGIAISYDAYSAGNRSFVVSHTQYAGEAVTSCPEGIYAVEIMTGATLCKGCDVVIRYEDVQFEEINGQKMAKVLDENVQEWKNIHRQGIDENTGNVLLETGREITIGVISILATTGYDKVKVRRRPKVAIISTGDELVDVGEIPLPHQIRKSNVVSISAVLNSLNIDNTQYHLKDDKNAITEKLKGILNDYDILLLSGGVSMGKADYIPQALEEIGVKQRFHKVSQRPGKPFWFGDFQEQKPVFALPGNPISTLMCFNVYFLPWLKSNLGQEIVCSRAVLSEGVNFKPNLDYFLHVKLQWFQEQLIAIPVKGNGSGDVIAFGQSNAFIHLPKEEDHFIKGRYFDVFYHQ